jgi:hypothetical protein
MKIKENKKDRRESRKSLWPEKAHITLLFTISFDNVNKIYC